MPAYTAFAKADKVHPLYARWAWFYRFYQLHYLGGPEFDTPDIDISYLRPTVTQEGNATEPTINFTGAKLSTFLFPDNKEELPDFMQRVARSSGVRTNYCRPVIDLYTAQLFNRSALREYGAASVLDTIWKDVDLRGSSIDEWMSEGVTGAQVFGHMFAVLEMSDGADQVRTL